MNEIERYPRPAVFLDRDGTIIDDLGYLSRPEQVIFFSDTITSLLRLQEHYELFIVTNQSGVAKGLVSMEDVECVNAYILSHLSEAGVRIVETYVCPHNRGDGCLCMKPKPYFLIKARKEHFIDLERSFVIGDHPHDVDFALSVGARGIYVLSGHGEKHRKELSEGVLIADGIGEAAELILKQAI